MARPNPGIGQGGLFVPEENRAPELPEGFDLNRRTTFSHLIWAISEELDLPLGYTTQEDLERIEPENVQAGLCFGSTEARRLELKNVYDGIGFSATQFLDIARSPRDLADHTYSRADKANENRTPEERLDRDTARDTAMRAAGHSLESHVIKLESLRGQLSEQRLCLIALYREIASPGKAHWSGRNLDGLRKTASDIIHGDIEIAAVNLPWDHRTANDLQRALHYNLYGRRGKNNTRIEFWRRYVSMADGHTRRQYLVAGHALRRTMRELGKYTPYLEAAKTKADEE